METLYHNFKAQTKGKIDSTKALDEIAVEEAGSAIRKYTSLGYGLSATISAGR